MIRRAVLACVFVTAVSGTASAFECAHYLEAIDVGLDLAKRSTDAFWSAMSPAARKEVRRLRDQGEAACDADDRAAAAQALGEAVRLLVEQREFEGGGDQEPGQ